MWRTVPMDKAEARRAVRRGRRRRRDTQPAADRDRDAAALAGQVLALVGEAPSSMAAYVSLPTEPPTEALLTALRERGHEVLLPVLLPDRDLDWRHLDAAASDLLGPDAIGHAELVLVPALAVDRQGARLGQGGGSYDRALARRAPASRVIACVYDDELATRVPTADHDQRVDGVLTPLRGYLSLPR